MKIPLCFSFLLLGPFAFSQGYLENDPRWGQYATCAVPYPCIANDDFIYFTAGDSLIGGVTWTKILREGVINYYWSGPPPIQPGCSGVHPYGPELSTAKLIRQQDRQLHIMEGNVDYLLYEFDLEVGDTLPLTYNNWNEDIVVIAVDSVLIGTQMRARFELGNSWAQYLIEGVGSSNGLFEPVSGVLECGYELRCFGSGDTAYYPTVMPFCGLPMGIVEQEKLTVQVSPVPAYDVLHVTSAGPLGSISIIDCNGRSVLTTTFGNSRSGEIDITPLGDGAYYLRSAAALQRFMVMK